MAPIWKSPIYTLQSKSGKRITIDVSSSVSAGLPPNKIFHDVLIKLFRENGVETIVDFGAGALRHTIPLLKAGFQVCGVEFEEQYKKPACAEAMAKVGNHHNFCKLIWPSDFKKDDHRFDAGLLCYVLQTMPLKEERDLVLKILRKKLRDDSFLLWMSRYGQLDRMPKDQAVRDGFFMSPERDTHSFYTEFQTEATHEMMGKHGFKRLRSLSERGTEQVFLYQRKSSTWI
jgi:hypothetical protein